MARMIPTDSTDPFFDQLTELDGVNYILQFRLNQRENRWYLSIQTEAGVDLLKGIKLVGGVNFLDARRSETQLPTGNLFLSVPPLDPSPPGFGELGAGKRCALYYESLA